MNNINPEQDKLEEKQAPDDKKHSFNSTYMIIGMCIGAAIGVALDYIAIGLAIGTGIGVAIGFGASKGKK